MEWTPEICPASLVVAYEPNEANAFVQFFLHPRGFQTYSFTERRFPDLSTSSRQTGILVWHMTIIFTFVFYYCQQ